MIRIQVNGQDQTLEESISLNALLERLNLPRLGLAVALNAQVVPQSKRDEIRLKDGDRVEIIRAVAGG